MKPDIRYNPNYAPTAGEKQALYTPLILGQFQAGSRSGAKMSGSATLMYSDPWSLASDRSNFMSSCITNATVYKLKICAKCQ